MKDDTSAASPPPSSTPTATRRSSTARCTSRCTCRLRTATATRASSPRCSRAARTGYAYGRQGNPTSAALEAKVTAMEGGVGTVAFATGMAAIGAIMMALLKAGDHIVSSQYVFGNTTSLLLTLEGARPCGVVRRRHRRGEGRGRAHARHPHRVRRDHRQSARAGRGPRAHRRALQGARHPVRRRQHDDLALAVPAEGRRREPRRQCAHQVHRRPRQRARRQRSPTPGSSTGRAIPTSTTRTRRSRRATGACSSCARRACATWAARSPPSRRTTSRWARRRWRCAWSASARNALALAQWLARAAAGARGLLPGLAVASAARARGASCSAAFGGLAVLRARRRHRPVRLPQPAEDRGAVVEPGRQPDARDSGRAHDLLRDGRRSAARPWASPTR